MSKRQAQLKGVNLLTIAPVRLADWEEADGRVVVLRPAPTRGGIKGAVDRLLYQLSARRIRLDDTGSFAWLRLDGTCTVGEVARLLREQFGEGVEPAEERLARLIWALRREELIAYPGWDDATVGGSPSGPRAAVP